MSAPRRRQEPARAGGRGRGPQLRLAAGDPFEALADPTRRAILSMLGQHGERTAGAVAAAFPRITRPAVSRHLRILREAGLVTVGASGRERRYALDVRALRALHEEWFGQFVPLWDAALRTLKRRAESDRRASPQPVRGARAHGESPAR